MFIKPYVNCITRCLIRAAHEKVKLPLFNGSKFNPKLYGSSTSCCKQFTDSKGILNSLENNYNCDKSKLKIISQLNLKSEEDTLPFCKLPIKSLLQIYKITKADEQSGNCQNRLYFLAERLKCTPSHLSKLIVRRPFIYSLSFEWLKSSLDTLLEMGVSEDRIIRDLWVLKYHTKTIEERLTRVKEMGVDNIYPWMVRCSEKTLNRTISISQETKNILGDVKSTKNYLATRLNTTPEVVENMYFTIPALERIRASKVKNFLDFLIEEGFEVEDIVTKPRVISASQKTVKSRLDKLRKLGLKEINLNVLCRSRKDFQRYCESIKSSLNTEKS